MGEKQNERGQESEVAELIAWCEENARCNRLAAKMARENPLFRGYEHEAVTLESGADKFERTAAHLKASPSLSADPPKGEPIES